MIKMRKKPESTKAFTVTAHPGITVSTTKAYWDIITHIKHPSVKGKEKQVQTALKSPDEIRISKKDNDVHLYYRKYRNLYLCVVVKIQDKQGFIITAYYTEKIKEGGLTWKK